MLILSSASGSSRPPISAMSSLSADTDAATRICSGMGKPRSASRDTTPSFFWARNMKHSSYSSMSSLRTMLITRLCSSVNMSCRRYRGPPNSCFTRSYTSPSDPPRYVRISRSLVCSYTSGASAVRIAHWKSSPPKWTTAKVICSFSSVIAEDASSLPTAR